MRERPPEQPAAGLPRGARAQFRDLRDPVHKREGPQPCSPVSKVGVHVSVRRDIREMDRIELTNVPLYCVIKLQG
jgi:hypothetical protein